MDDMGLCPSRHALSEHHDIDECVEDLANAPSDGRSWLPKAKKLSETVRHHLREEEKKFFQTSGKILGDAQKKKLASQYRRDYARMLRTLADARAGETGRRARSSARCPPGSWRRLRPCSP